MREAVFFRLLKEDVYEKPAVLGAQLAALNSGNEMNNVFTAVDRAFGKIPGSPFAYWTPKSTLKLFDLNPLEGEETFARLGATTNDDFRFLNLFWEIMPHSLHSYWIPFAKGGSYSPYFFDTHLVLDWEDKGQRLREFCVERGDSPSRNIRSEDKYFRPGLTWPRRTNGFSVRILPAGCIFADKGPAAFVQDNKSDSLMTLMAVMNSTIFEYLVRLQLARTELAQSYEVGLIQNTPVPEPSDERLAPLAHRAHDLQRENYIHDETTHVFGLPGLVEWRGGSLMAASFTLEEQAAGRSAELGAVQSEIDAIVFDLYGLDEADRQLVLREMGSADATAGDLPLAEDEGDADEAEDAAPENLPERVQNLLMWCVGVAFGRWDVRKALDPALLPPLPGPFDPLPRCAPGALMDADGLPLERDDLPEDYPLPVAWDGVLLDDPQQESNPTSRDIVARVRAVLTLLWGDRADAIEREICSVLQIRDLRDYYRHPTKGLFHFHIKRYSKSRRKAPIYWLLQSDKRGIGVWLYYPRITENTLFTVENLLYDLLRREGFRLEERKSGLETLTGGDRKAREHEIATQADLVEQVTGFHKTILRLANQKLPPDPNDGVLIGIAPLHELVPWKDARRMWDKLVAGDYPWSQMAAQMRQRGFLGD
jgi:hypothetical protein